MKVSKKMLCYKQDKDMSNLQYKKKFKQNSTQISTITKQMKVKSTMIKKKGKRKNN